MMYAPRRFSRRGRAEIGDSMNRRDCIRGIAGLALGIAGALLAGCGNGSSSPATTGRAAFTIQWVAPTRAAVTTNGNSVRITLSDNGATPTERLVTRPSDNTSESTITFEGLQPGAHSFTATSYSTSDGTGSALATITTAVTITSGQTAQTTLSTVPTIDRVDVTPAQAALKVGDKVAVSASMVNSQ